MSVSYFLHCLFGFNAFFAKKYLYEIIKKTKKYNSYSCCELSYHVSVLCNMDA